MGKQRVTVVFQEKAVIGLIDVTELAFAITGNRLSVAYRGQRQDHDIPYYDNPFYASFEDFCRTCGEEHFGVALADLTLGAGRVLYLYDKRPQRDPLWSELTEAQRAMLDPEEEVDSDGFVVGYTQGGNFGYAYNIIYPELSEWGYAPLPLAGETMEQMAARKQAGLDALRSAAGGNVTVIEGPQVGRVIQ